MVVASIIFVLLALIGLCIVGLGVKIFFDEDGWMGTVTFLFGLVIVLYCGYMAWAFFTGNVEAIQ